MIIEELNPEELSHLLAFRKAKTEPQHRTAKHAPKPQAQAEPNKIAPETIAKALALHLMQITQQIHMQVAALGVTPAMIQAELDAEVKRRAHAQ